MERASKEKKAMQLTFSSTCLTKKLDALNLVSPNAL